MDLSRTHKGVFIAVALVTCSTAFGQFTPGGFLIVENYYWSRSGKEGGQNRLSWAEGQYRFSPNLKVVGSFIELPTPGKDLQFLDEGYLEYRTQDKVIRAGRIRTRMGFGDWAELFYTPIALWPMARVNPINSLALLRFDTGFDIQGGTPELTYQVGMVDVHSDTWQLAPRRLDHGSARLQTAQGDFILGVSALSRLGNETQNDTMAGVDLRWSSDHTIVRAEYDRGFDHGPNAETSCFDVFYRPEKLYRTQFGVRQQFYRPLGGATANLTSVGFRQILSKNFALTTNYAFGNHAPAAANTKGWTIQLMSAVKF